MYYISILIVICANILYNIFQSMVPIDVNTLIALCTIYISSLILTIILYFKTRNTLIKSGFENKISWQVIAFGLTIILIDTGFLLAYREGWEFGLLNIILNFIVLIILAIIGKIFFKENLSFINILGIGIGILGVTLLNIN